MGDLHLNRSAKKLSKCNIDLRAIRNPTALRYKTNMPRGT